MRSPQCVQESQARDPATARGKAPFMSTAEEQQGHALPTVHFFMAFIAFMAFMAFIAFFMAFMAFMAFIAFIAFFMAFMAFMAFIALIGASSAAAFIAPM